MNNAFVFLYMAFLLPANSAWADAPAKSLSLSEIVQMATERSPLIEAQGFEVKAKESLVGNAGAWSNPEISIESERKEDAASRETNSLKYGLTQRISMPGRFSAKRDVAEAEASIERLNLTDILLKTKVTVSNLAYEYAADLEKAKHAEERLRRFQSVHAYIRSRTFASPQKKTEAGIVSAKLLVLQKELEILQAEVGVTWNRLNFYLNLPQVVRIDVVWFKSPNRLVETELTKQAEEKSPELARLRFEGERSKSELTVANREKWPEMTLNGAISNGSGFEPEKIYTLGVSIPIPVFNANRSVAKAQGYRLQANEARLKALSLNIKRFLNSAFVRYQTKFNSLGNLQISKIAEIEKSFAQTDSGFKKGLVDLLTYLEADSQHAETISAIYDTQVEFAESVGELSLLTGQFLLPLEKHPVKGSEQ